MRLPSYGLSAVRRSRSIALLQVICHPERSRSFFERSPLAVARKNRGAKTRSVSDEGIYKRSPIACRGESNIFYGKPTKVQTRSRSSRCDSRFCSFGVHLTSQKFDCAQDDRLFFDFVRTLRLLPYGLSAVRRRRSMKARWRAGYRLTAQALSGGAGLSPHRRWPQTRLASFVAW